MFEYESVGSRVNWYVRGLHRATMQEPANANEGYLVTTYEGKPHSSYEESTEYNTYSGAEAAIMSHLRRFE